MKKLILALTILSASVIAKAQTEVTFYTTMGNFVVEIYDDQAPITGGNFLDLVDKKFYDGVIFHRVIDNFMIQGGDPTGTGTGGPGYTIADEFIPGLSNLQKTISMANTGQPNSGGSQFFINLVDNTYLDYDKAPLTSKHPVFGMTVMNFNIVQSIGKVATDANNRPLTNVVMDSIRVGNFFTVGVEKPSVVRNTMSVIPNPISPQSFLNVNLSKTTEATIAVFDNMGKLIASQNVHVQKGSNRILLSDIITTDLSSGMYYLNFIVEGENHSLTLVSQ